ncbi:MAG: hypothetical protein HFJ55_02260 [Clostridia bacterium]|jgi:hypothetical protein|nr:hypothetical protein [Clostridia bacterium]
MSINVGIDFSKLNIIDYIEELKKKTQMKIFKDDKGMYSTYIPCSEAKGNGVYAEAKPSKFMVQLPKGRELKNKSIIMLKSGFIANTKKKKDDKYNYYDKLIIKDYDLLEEGIDEVQKTKQPKQEPQDSFAFDIGQDELPF